jgi:hypothetical protein
MDQQKKGPSKTDGPRRLGISPNGRTIVKKGVEIGQYDFDRRSRVPLPG